MELTTMLDSWSRSQSIPAQSVAVASIKCPIPTLFAGLVLSFSKIFCDWAFVATAMTGLGVTVKGYDL